MKKALKIALLTPLCLLLALVLAVVCLDVWATHFRIPSAQEKGWQTSESPDGRFRVTGYSTKSVFSMRMAMPGGGSDGIRYGPGIVILWDNKTGKILQKARVETLVAHENVDWRIGEPDAVWRKNWGTPQNPWKGDYVRVKFLDTWPLPSEDGKMPPPPPKITILPASPEAKKPSP
ncbi:MAG: hypothetical protein LBP52_10750 [Burkholderiaceae bacterium]|jgi:hypothetical protein|nr:hypothetical protein [Burkholderiaceae bacterium]